MERAMETPTKEEMVLQFQDDMQNGWISRIFKADGGDREHETVYTTMPMAFNMVIQDNRS